MMDRREKKGFEILKMSTKFPGPELVLKAESKTMNATIR